jgi:hypothetical protein
LDIPIPELTEDFNNDTQIDIIVSNSGIGNIVILIGYGNAHFILETTYSLGSNSRPQYVIVNHFNKDNRLDIAITNFLGRSINVFLGYGNGSFDKQLVIPTDSGSNPNSIASGNFNNDTLLDIIVTNSNTHNIGIYFGSLNGTFQNLRTYSTVIASYPVSVIVGDFNEDNIPDVIVAIYGTNNIGIFIGYGNGSFADQIPYPIGYDSRSNSISFGNFNNNSLIDIAVANYPSSSINILLNCPAV